MSDGNQPSLADALRAQGAAAERERIFRTPHTQHFEVDDCLLRCEGCEAQLAENRMTHRPGCSEMRLADLLGGGQ